MIERVHDALERRVALFFMRSVLSCSPVEDFVPILPTTRRSACTVQNSYICPQQTVNIAQVMAAVPTAVAMTLAVTMVSVTTLAVITKNALTDLTTLTTMTDGLALKAREEAFALQHNMYVQLGLNGCTFRL